MKRLLQALVTLGCAFAAHASTIHSTDKFAYAQSAGWLNLRPGQSGGGEGVSVTFFHLSGTAYGQSTGWVDLGDGTPVDGLRYSNSSASDMGVNMDLFYNLSGYAYAQSIGWINFGWAAANDPNRPRINPATNEFLGYVYAQSIGWINLGAGFLRTQDYLQLPDTDGDGLPDAWELVQAGDLTTLGNTSDTDGDGILDWVELFYLRSLTFVNAISDYDGDGYTDKEELAAGTDLFDPLSQPPNNSNIFGDDTFVYGQSVGWINLKHNQPSAPSGVAVSVYRLRGTAWGQSMGWINLGDGSPDNGLRYSNTSAGDCGVNMDYKGDLSGYAYAQSAGWIHFGWSSPTDPNRPRINLLTRAFEGYAYGQSIGWVNLGDFNVFTELFEFLPDSDTDGLPDSWELEVAGNLSTLNAFSDSDGDGIADRDEFQWFRSIDIANATSDTDGDGLSDAQEILYGSNPTDPFSLPPGTGTNVGIDFAFMYGQSIGWINAIHNQPNFPSGLRLRDTHIMGQAWGQSVGWIHFGSGSPSNGRTYSNNTAADIGVNMDGLGNLSGYAYGQSCGWINFGWATANDANRPRLNLDTGDLEGFAYGQSIGWVNLSGIRIFELERPDTDFDGIGDAWELEHFGNLTTADFGTDSDEDGQSDYLEYLAGTDPLNNASRFMANPVKQPGQFEITFPSTPTRRYTISSSANLIDWEEILPLKFVPDAGDFTTRNVPLLLGSEGEFFRVEAFLPLSGGGTGVGD
jgi:hypothetical protein